MPISVVGNGSEPTQSTLRLDLGLTSVVQNNNSAFPDIFYEASYEAIAYRTSLANSKYSYVDSNVKIESNPSTMWQTSQDSGYESELYSPTESLNSPTSNQYFDSPYFKDNFIRVSGSESAPLPSRSHPRSSKSAGKGQNTISSSNSPTSPSSTSTKPKPYCCVWPRCEATFARAYDLGRHQKTKHTTAQRFDCPEENCRRYGIPESPSERGGFTRLDHFRDHVKHLHGKDVIKDKDRDGGQHWVFDPNELDRTWWMRDKTGSIMMKDTAGRIWMQCARTGRW